MEEDYQKKITKYIIAIISFISFIMFYRKTQTTRLLKPPVSIVRVFQNNAPTLLERGCFAVVPIPFPPTARSPSLPPAQAPIQNPTTSDRVRLPRPQVQGYGEHGVQRRMIGLEGGLLKLLSRLRLLKLLPVLNLVTALNLL